MAEDKINCTRCGKCCYLYIEGKKIKCRHLIKLPFNKTLCRIFNSKKRIGSITHEYGRSVFRCDTRENSEVDFIGCPYNTDKPLIEESNDKLTK